MAQDPEIYQVHVWIRRISPMIWRRLLVRSDCTLADLHYGIENHLRKRRSPRFEMVSETGRIRIARSTGYTRRGLSRRSTRRNAQRFACRFISCRDVLLYGLRRKFVVPRRSLSRFSFVDDTRHRDGAGLTRGFNVKRMLPDLRRDFGIKAVDEILHQLLIVFDELTHADVTPDLFRINDF